MDTKLIGRADAAAWDEQGFLAAYVAIQPTLRSYLATLIGGAADVDDVMQEVSVALLHSFSRYDSSRPFIGWALGVARNHASRWNRQRSTDARRFSAAAEEALAIAYQEIEPELEPRRRALRACLKRLDVASRQLLHLRYVRRLTLADIALVRECTVNAVNKTLGKLRRLLMACAERETLDP